MVEFRKPHIQRVLPPRKKKIGPKKKTAKQKSNNVKMYDEKRVVKKIMQSKTRTKRLFRLSMLNTALMKRHEHEPS